MFTIIGGDGQEYGPATAAQLRSWLAAGRANLATKAKAVGTDEWRRLGDFAEFAAGGDAEVPPVLPASGVASGEVEAIAIAEPGIRLLARGIDWAFEIACCVPGMLKLGPLFLQFGESMLRGEQPDFEQLDKQALMSAVLIFSIGWLVPFITQVILLSTRGQSLGKLLTGLRVVRLDGSRAGFLHAWLLREAVITLIGAVISILPFIGPLLLRPAFHVTDWCLIFRRDRRCLHDQIADTRVVKI